jgi:hypothetical protein
MNYFLPPGSPKNLSMHFRGRSDIFRVDKRLHSHFEWKWHLDGLRDRFPMLPFACSSFFRDETVFPQSKIGPGLPLIHSGFTCRDYFSAYCFGAILSTPFTVLYVTGSGVSESRALIITSVPADTYQIHVKPISVSP